MKKYLTILNLIAVLFIGLNAEQPNVIIVMTDDQGYGDLSCHGNPYLKTPNLDRLYKDSIRLTNFHVSTVCAPTRAALMTGKFPRRSGVWSTTTDLSLMKSDSPTLAEHFKRNGYQTAMYGKWHLGSVEPYRPSDRGFQESLYEPGGMIGMSCEAWGNDVVDAIYHHNNKPKQYRGYRTDIWFEESMKWMKQQKDQNKPFLTYLATLAPHGPHWVDPKYAEAYRELKLGKAENFFAMIANIDENIGKLDKFLKDEGLRENTILIFMTDNGGTAGVGIHNSGMRGRKGQCYEGGHRVPFFIRWPKGALGGGVDLKGLGAHIDLFPTLSELCGLPLPEQEIDGVSFANALQHKNKLNSNRFLFIRSDTGQAKKGGYQPDKFKNSGVIYDQWRLVDGKELYDIDKDPAQEKNVADDFPHILKKLRQAQSEYFQNTRVTYDWDKPLFIPVNGEEAFLTPLYARPTENRKSISSFHGKIIAGHPSRGKWSIEIEREGEYEFELRRWPRELNLGLTDTSPALKKKYLGYREGKALPISAASLKIGHHEQLVEAKSKASKDIRVKMHLKPGVHSMQAHFLDKSGDHLSDVYYIYARLHQEKISADEIKQRVRSPNIVFFMADDLGTGDIQCYNPDSSVPTPHIDALAKMGTRFTDAHSPSAVCSPTRYSVLTGRYPWRDGLNGALQGVTDPKINRNQPVVSKFLQSYGYHTAMIGKWHIGLRFAGDYKWVNFGKIQGKIDFSMPLIDGPTHHGFDYFFGVNGNFNLAQHLDFWIENDRILDADFLVPKTEIHPKRKMVLDAWESTKWDARDLTKLPLKKALTFMEEHRTHHPERPFYLHFTPNAIHKDFFPNESLHGQKVKGRGGLLRERGELIVETDIMLGAIVNKLKDLGIYENTIVVFTSDNGGQGAEEALEVGHRINGPWAGCKGMILEGGHRVPYILSYPDGGVKANAVDDKTELGLVDWFPSVASYVAGSKAMETLPPLDGSDRSALFSGQKPQDRKHALIYSGSNKPIGKTDPHPIMGKRFGAYAVRQGNWKLIVEGLGGKPRALYDLMSDPGETNNLLKKHPERVKELRQSFLKSRDAVDAKNISPKNKQARKSIEETNPDSKQPDVLFIAIDDMNDWTTLFDANNPIKTPNLKRLAARGAFFSKAYCASPGCNPSRTAIMTGLLPTTSGVYENQHVWRKALPEAVTIPQYFEKYGYLTKGGGKILHHGPSGAEPEDNASFQEFFERIRFPSPKIRKGAFRCFDWGEIPKDQMADTPMIEWAEKQLQSSRNKPLFLAAGIFHPHLPHFAPPDIFAQYPFSKTVMPPMPAGDLEDIPPLGLEMARKEWNWKGYLFDNPPAEEDPASLKSLVRAYQASSTYADRMVGRLIDQLDKTGRSENTIVVLWSDHGYHLGDKKSTVKFTLWEKANHVPFIIVAPGVTSPGTRIDIPVSLVEIYATLAELAGLPGPEGLDSRSLVPLLKNPNAAWGRPALMTQGKGNHAIRTSKWRYIHYSDGAEELYDCETDDPWNHTNLLANGKREKYSSILEDLKRGLPRNEAMEAPLFKRKKRL